MIKTRETPKLAQLRAKTDRQLLAYLAARLEHALAVARAGESRREAERFYDELRHLLPLVKEAHPMEWRRLTARMVELSELLDGICVAHPAA